MKRTGLRTSFETYLTDKRRIPAYVPGEFVTAPFDAASGGEIGVTAAGPTSPPLDLILRETERFREKYWASRPATADARLQRRAVTLRQLLHILPGETVLEIGAGSGLWTRHLDEVLRGESRIVAAVFNGDLAAAAGRRQYKSTEIVRAAALDEFERGGFDYVVASNMIGSDVLKPFVRECSRLLRPGGKLLSFEANHFSPTVWWQDSVRSVRKRLGFDYVPYSGLTSRYAANVLRDSAFASASVFPFDCILRRMPSQLSRVAADAAHFIEHSRILQNACGTVAILATRDGQSRNRPLPNLADRREFFDAVSVVVLCRNEESNIEPLCRALFGMFRPYIHELLMVDDNSSDGTAEVAEALSKEFPQIRVIRRKMPNGVGRALRDGCSAATGRYILTMDCDFAWLVPELRDLFDKLAEGHDGVIGSRFSPHSVLVRYPYLKMVCNRAAHASLRLFTRRKVHDVSNNLKLYRREVFEAIAIRKNHFAANLETGFRPLMHGFDVVEVPVSWADRDTAMGRSSFRILSVGPEYVSAVFMLIGESIRQAISRSPRPAPATGAGGRKTGA